MFESEFDGRLMSGERLEWTGKPSSGIMFTGQDLFLIPFAILWTSIPLFGLFSSSKRSNGVAPLPFQLVPLLFVAIGFYLIIGRFITDMWVRSRTFYAISNQRILILRKVPTIKFTALAIDRLPELSLSERSNGTGTIQFQQSVSFFGNRGFSSWTPGLSPMPQFLAVPDARNVFALIQKLSARNS